MPSLSHAIERLYELKVGTTPLAEGAPHERPHKPLLLLAIFDLIDEGLATPDRVLWCRALRERFTARFEIVRKHNDRNNPDLPFRHLAGDGFWLALEGDGITPIRRDILAADLDRVFGRFVNGFEVLISIPESRLQMREAIVSRYFPQHAASLLAGRVGIPAMNYPPGDAENQESRLAELPSDPAPGRSSAFRRKILEVYDHQCAACGLRIRLPQAYDVSFIDAAHLIPFSFRWNDHPTNGLALCKNHHWALDRHLIAPTLDYRWSIAPSLDSRRSTGEAELFALGGRPILLPTDEAFHPSLDSIQWRIERLLS